MTRVPSTNLSSGGCSRGKGYHTITAIVKYITL